MSEELKTAAPSVAPEPVAWFRKDRMKAMGDDEKAAWIMSGQSELVEDYTIPLFEHPPRAPLTDAEIDKAITTSRDALLDHIFENSVMAEGVCRMFRDVARAIEAAHGIGAGRAG